MKKTYIKYLSILFMVFPMSLVMALVGVFRVHGFSTEWPTLFLKSWAIMFPVAFLSALLFSPIAKKLSERLNSRIKEGKGM